VRMSSYEASCARERRGFFREDSLGAISNSSFGVCFHATRDKWLRCRRITELVEVDYSACSGSGERLLQKECVIISKNRARVLGLYRGAK
jgi:hypothetical protein